MQQLTAHTAINLLFEDFARFGVTDVLANTTSGIAALSSVRKVQAVAEPSEQLSALSAPRQTPVTALKTPKAVLKPQTSQEKNTEEHKKPNLDPAKCTFFIKGDLPVTIALSGVSKTWPFVLAEEHTLLANMLKALGLTLAENGPQPSWLVFLEEAGTHMPPLRVVDIQALHAHLCTMVEVYEKQTGVVFALGAQVCGICTGDGNAFMHRHQPLKSAFAAAQFFGTYGLNALLRQPQLKRQAWKDMQGLKETLKEIIGQQNG